MQHHSRRRHVIVLAWLALAVWPSLAAQGDRIYWLDALCGDDPVTRQLHEQIGALAKSRGWSPLPVPAGCQWHSGRLSPAERVRAIDQAATRIAADMRAVPAGSTVLALANSTIAARLGDPRPLIVNPRALTRPVYLFSTNDEVLCSKDGKPGPLKVGYVRGTARPVEIREAIARETGRLPSMIEARELNAISDFYDRLGSPEASGVDVAAIVADDVGGVYAEFNTRVIAKRPGVRPVSLCTAVAPGSPTTLEPRLRGSVTYLKVVRVPEATRGVGGGLSELAFVRPGQDPEEVAPKSMAARIGDSIYGSAQAAGTAPIKPSDFRDFPTLMAAGPAAPRLSDDLELKSVVSNCYFEGMFDAFAGGLNPCATQSNLLFGVFLLGAYSDDAGNEYKGCALQAYYELMSTLPERSGREITRHNVDILQRRLKNCIGTTGAMPRAEPLAGAASAGAVPPCAPTEKERNEARAYGEHYPYFRAALTAIASALKVSGPVRSQGLATAEECLRTALSKSTVKRDCATFSQGLFVVPYEPALPYGIIRLKSGK